MPASVLLVDKPKGITSTKVVEGIKRKFKVKAGHAGTLDPIATGLLIVLVDLATRYAEFFQNLPKEYVAKAKFGEVTDTYDADGKVLEVREVNISCEDINKVLPEFVGKVLQSPPPYSAKKVKGVRAYQLARKGKEVELKPVEVEVLRASMLNCQLPYAEFVFEVSSGTYIRSLIHDIGLKLGCGAHLVELRRTKIGSFSVDVAIPYERILSLEDLSDVALPIDDALSFLPDVKLSPQFAKKIRMGMFLNLSKSFENKTFVRLYENDTFLGVGVIERSTLKPYRLLPT